MTGPNEITMGFSSMTGMGDIAYKEVEKINLAIKGRNLAKYLWLLFLIYPSLNSTRLLFVLVYKRECLMTGALLENI